MDSNNLTSMWDKWKMAMDPNTPYTDEMFYEEYGFTKLPEPEFDGTLAYVLNVNFVNTSGNPDPEFATSGSAGFDLRSAVDITIESGEFEKVPTGLFFELPLHFEMQVRPRSGLAAKYGVTVLNTPGTIDSDYRGEIIVILINHGKEPFKIEKGDRIAQGIIAQTTRSYINLNRVDQISDNTDRSSGGFGSTGIK